jgi:hypothetical protein
LGSPDLFNETDRCGTGTFTIKTASTTCLYRGGKRQLSPTTGSKSQQAVPIRSCEAHHRTEQNQESGQEMSRSLLTAEEARMLLNSIPVTRTVKLAQLDGRSQAAIKNLLCGQCSELAEVA